MNVGSASEWDSGFLEGPSVIKEDGQYKMWYCGYDIEVNGQASDGKANIGYATSTDGINWIKYENNPILVTGNNTWDSIYVQDPHVIKYGDEYQMWYGGGDNDTYYSQQVGYATSTDGINWNKSPLNPVLTRGNDGDWDKIFSIIPFGNYKGRCISNVVHRQKFRPCAGKFLGLLLGIRVSHCAIFSIK
jgi:predicted GH43/DUF377 family glycosyl hydrolase